MIREEDLAIEATVLRRLLDVYPARLTESELIREVAGEDPSLEERDAIECAVRNLVDAGLVHGSDRFVTPTRAALRSREILGHGA